MTYIKRTIAEDLMRQTPPKAVVIYGARRTGKTTVLRELLKDEDVVWYSGDEPDDREMLRLNSASDVKALLTRTRFLVIDEAQRIPDIGLTLKRLVDMNETLKLRIVASGMKDSVGLYAKPTDEEYKKCEIWLRIFGIDNLANRNFLSLSSGEQRIVLLARAFVKDPQLLILDEPFHGLDNRNRNKVRCIINAFAKRKDKAIIMVSHYKEEYPTCINKEIELKRNQ